jgi:hypothetical protein
MKNDIPLEDLINEKEDEHQYVEDLSLLPQDEKEQMLHAGVDTQSDKRSGTFIMKDQSVVHCNIRQQGIELLSTKKALEKYDGLKKYMWQLVQPDKDKYTEHVKNYDAKGYFIKAEKGARSYFPVQSCLFLNDPGTIQDVHNIIIAGEDSELEVLTGCTSKSGISQNGAHLGVSEIYVKRGAKVTYSMIHNWDENVIVRPRTGIIIEEGGTFISNYICLKPVKDVQMEPVARLVGKNAVALFNTILVAGHGSNLDIGSRVYLEEEGTKAEITSRALTTGGKITARGFISGNVSGCKGHLECQGLVLNDDGSIYTIPELDGLATGVELSHEAAIGKIAQDEVEYLMARGLSEKDAVGVIVRGFLNVEIIGLPYVLKKEIDSVIEKIKTSAF